MTAGARAGISLIEVLVSITILALATSIALLLYDTARQSFKVGDNLAEQQQVVRIGFDIVSRDVRAAGFNVNPDGDKQRPDEQIEGAFATAIVLRADLDGDDPARSSTPEDALAGGAFQVVSTGNDEIVAYVLAKPDGSSTEELVFDADVENVPRDGVPESVTIGNVDLSQTDPPYTLFRVTVNDAAVTTSRAPLVDNVRRLRFTYHDGAGGTLAPPGGLDDPAGVNAALRRRIRRVGIELEGLTRNPDPRWRDKADPDEDTRSFRKFLLSGDVTPPNLGLFGLRDLEAFSLPPSRPSPPVLHPGHCGGLYAAWSPNPPQDEVARYEVRWGQNPSALGGPQYAVAAETYLAGLLDGVQYYATVTAVDDSGSPSEPSDPASATTANDNTPESPPNLVCSTDLNGRVHVVWDAAVNNTTAVPVADPLAPRMRDFKEYTVHRGSSPSFGAAAGNQISTETGTIFDDDRAVNCRPYYYRVRARDLCGEQSDESPAVAGRATPPPPVPGLPSPGVPEAPLNAQAFIYPGTKIRVQWDAVSRDVAGNPIWIEDYRVFAAGPLPEGVTPPAFALVRTVSNATVFDHNVTPPSGQTYYYRVSATDDCPNESALSNIAEADCPFAGQVKILRPFPNQNYSGTVVVEVDVVGGSGSYQSLELTISRQSTGGVVLHLLPLNPSFPYQTQWTANLSPPGQYRIDVQVIAANGCVQKTTIANVTRF